MTTFWILVSVMLIGGIAALVPALTRAPRAGERAGVAGDLHAQRLDELRADVADGAMSDNEANTAREEIDRALLADSDLAARGHRGATRGERLVGIAFIALVVPAVAFSVYLTVGIPELATDPVATKIAAGNPTTEEPHASFDQMVKELEERLQDEPDNAQGWELLARTYETLQDYPKAVAAIERVYGIAGEKPAVMLQYANMLGMASGGTLQGKPTTLIKRALELEPDNLTALWLAGFAEQEDGDTAAALKHWRHARSLAAPDTQLASDLQAMLEKFGGQVVEATPVVEAAPPAAADGPSIKVSVRIAAHLRERLSPTDTVFVFARRLEGAPIPLAVARRTADELPFDVTLDDSMAMSPQNNLSSAAQVRLVARVSKSGNARAQSGDLEGEALPIAVGTPDTIEIAISSVVQ